MQPDHVRTQISSLPVSTSKGARGAGCAPGSMLQRLSRTAHSTPLGSCARIIIYMCWHKVITNGAEHHAQPLRAVPEETLGVTKQSALSMYRTSDLLPPQSFPLLPGEQLLHGRGVCPPFAPSSCLCQHIPGLYSETVSCPVIQALLPSRLSLMRSLGEGDIHIKSRDCKWVWSISLLCFSSQTEFSLNFRPTGTQTGFLMPSCSFLFTGFLGFWLHCF